MLSTIRAFKFSTYCGGSAKSRLGIARLLPSTSSAIHQHTRSFSQVCRRCWLLGFISSSRRYACSPASANLRKFLRKFKCVQEHATAVDGSLHFSCHRHSVSPGPQSWLYGVAARWTDSFHILCAVRTAWRQCTAVRKVQKWCESEAWHWHAGRLTGTRGCPDDLVERTSPCPLIHRSTCHSTASRSGLV